MAKRKRAAKPVVPSVKKVPVSVSMPENMRDALDEICKDSDERMSTVVTGILGRSSQVIKKMRKGA